MRTRPHLMQIQSTDSNKYPSLYEQVEVMENNISQLEELSVEAIVDTYSNLIALENKVEGFYLVNNDETYRNNPTHYYYDGESFKMVGERLPEGILKKTVVFYIKRLSEIGQSIKLFVPYKGYISYITGIINEPTSSLTAEIYDDEQLIDTINFQNSSFVSKTIFHSVDSSVLTLQIVDGDIGIENINVNIDIVVEE